MHEGSIATYEHEPETGEQRRLERARVRDLVRRFGHAMAVVIAANAVFAVMDLWLGHPQLSRVMALKLAQVGAIAAGVLVLTRIERRRSAIAVMVAVAALVYGAVAASGIVTADRATTPLLFLAMAIGSATYVPWGTAAQAVSVSCAMGALVANAIVVDAPADATTYYGLVAVLVSFSASLYIAWQIDEQRSLAIESRVAEKSAREAEAKRTGMLDAAMDGVVAMDEAGTVIEFNLSAERMFGLRRDQAVGKPMVELLIPQRLRSLHRRAFQRHLSAGQSGVVGRRVELPALRADGTEFPVELAVVRSHFEKRPIFTAYVRDLSTYKRTEAALRQSEAQLKGVFDATNVLLTLVEIEGDDFLMAMPNKPMANLFGSTPEDMAGRTGRQIGMPEDHVRFWMAQLRRCATSGPRRIPEYRLQLGERSYWFEVTLSPVWDAEGGPPQIAVAAVDITDRKSAEQEARQLNYDLEATVRERTAQLEAANKELEAIAHSVSHDLRTPLRTIEGFSQLLISEHAETMNSEARSHLERVRRASQRMAELLDDLLHLTRVLREEMHWEPVDLTSAARAVVADLRQREPARRVDVRIAEGMTAQGDARMLVLVLQNLLSNAWKYTGSLGVAHVEVGVTERAGEHTYFVRDDGCGFDMRYVDKLFRAFTCLHHPDEYEGTGIGLATVARIVRRHGGSVWAHGEVDHGATFYFTLGRPKSEELTAISA
ncbi:MAG TPA: PAS domain S-box protein [Candidatus Binatia bacterium]|nr:PAS domain S-box protein [Candidatus Binatia bacterium]